MDESSCKRRSKCLFWYLGCSRRLWLSLEGLTSTLSPLLCLFSDALCTLRPLYRLHHVQCRPLRTYRWRYRRVIGCRYNETTTTKNLRVYRAGVLLSYLVIGLASIADRISFTRVTRYWPLWI